MIYMVNTFKSLKNIEMYFMESGHSFLPNDTDFSHISRAVKNHSHIYVPENWSNIISNCTKKPFTVNNMFDKFKSFSDMDTFLINRKKKEDKQPISWMKIKWMAFERGLSR